MPTFGVSPYNSRAFVRSGTTRAGLFPTMFWTNNRDISRRRGILITQSSGIVRTTGATRTTGTASATGITDTSHTTGHLIVQCNTSVLKALPIRKQHRFTSPRNRVGIHHNPGNTLHLRQVIHRTLKRMLDD